jgi:hypothetical protein
MNWTEETIDFASLSQSEIKSKLNSLNIALSVDEILKVQNEILMRPPPHSPSVCFGLFRAQSTAHTRALGPF